MTGCNTFRLWTLVFFIFFGMALTARAEESNLYKVFSLNDLDEKPEKIYVYGENKNLISGRSGFTGIINNEEVLQTAIKECPELIRPFLKSVDFTKEVAFVGQHEYWGSCSMGFALNVSLQEKRIGFDVINESPGLMKGDYGCRLVYYAVKVSRTIPTILYSGRTYQTNGKPLSGLPFLKSLGWYRNSSDEELHNIQKVVLDGKLIKPYEVVNFLAIEKLKTIEFRNMTLTPEVLEALLKKKSLREVSFYLCTVGDCTFNFNESCIESMSFQCVVISRDCFAAFMGIGSLKDVRIISYNEQSGSRRYLGGHDENRIPYTEILKAMGKARNLERLLMDERITEQAAGFFPSLRKLKRLELKIDNGAEDVLLKEIAACKDMEYLSLKFECIQAARITVPLGGLSKITTLMLDGYSKSVMDKTAMIPISKLKNLQNLALSDLQIELGALKVLQGLDLQRLAIRNNKVLDNRCVVFVASTFPNLVFLNLQGCPLVTDASVRALSTLKELKQVNVYSTKIRRGTMLQACPSVASGCGNQPFHLQVLVGS